MAGLGDTDVQKRCANKLSGGMLRRLSLCNALMGSQHLLLLDELSSGVDPVIKRQIWRMLEHVNATVLLTSHDMQEIGEMAETLSILKEGKSVINDINQFCLREKYD